MFTINGQGDSWHCTCDDDTIIAEGWGETPNEAYQDMLSMLKEANDECG